MSYEQPKQHQKERICEKRGAAKHHPSFYQQSGDVLFSCIFADRLGSQTGKAAQSTKPSRRKKFDFYHDKHVYLAYADKLAQFTNGRSPIPNQHGLDNSTWLGPLCKLKTPYLKPTCAKQLLVG
jgi:hypothetical protein